MTPPIFSFQRVPLPGFTVRSVLWSVSAVAAVAVYALLHRPRRPRLVVPGLPVDGEPLTLRERDVLLGIAVMSEGARDVCLDDLLDPEEGPW